MKTARVRYEGDCHEATEANGQVMLQDGRMLTEMDVEWLPPIEPRTTFALGLNYADHASELAFQAPEEPLLFLKGPNTFVGHRNKTVRPEDVTFMHYECELAVVIGETARDVAENEAYRYVLGYTIANDYAFRDYLENYYRPNLRVKNRDHSTPLGPWLVTADEVPDPMNLMLRTYVNGVLTQEGSTRDMVFTIPQLIAHISSFMTLSKGDVILTGTPKGTVNVEVGDEIITEIEGLGKLANTIVREKQAVGRS
ncbi:fumarylacetoacetate hydrolase family protein [Shouchella lonarensis]|uniref:5-carboxy-2-oxohept-3-enedioate decarboxylase HpaG2 subunit n=1 Tax=Shouchella lonarensis TaxID=1464122 RepID=A0A1G6HJR7_9BACI|nr:fumarylacetoacetate hydrolase family protein [Shouchella lonarensis]SDB94577.1 5-carboxy-2-oxohept-3-enedioate decarboxylase HpaG2 subunit [Shouchella lonarensis]